ncbi:unnamed protein product [Sphacelaria rigidula]
MTESTAGNLEEAGCSISPIPEGVEGSIHERPNVGPDAPSASLPKA